MIDPDSAKTDSASDATKPNLKPSAPRLVAVTGATGFIGAALLDKLIASGRPVRALARTPAKLAPWSDHVEIIPGDLDNREALAALAKDAAAVVNLAALTHALDAAAFHQTNVEGARRAADAAAASGARFVHISSMAARAPDLSPYARSKADSEVAVAAAAARDHVILRLPAVYGPRDEATLPYFKMVRAGLAPEPALRREPRVSIGYVDDVANAIIAGVADAAAGATYEVGDDQAEGHSWREIGEALGRAFGRRPRRLRVPQALLRGYGAAAETVMGLLKRPTMVTRGKIAELCHPDWVARENLLSKACAWRAAATLDDGLAATVRWYRSRGLL